MFKMLETYLNSYISWSGITLNLSENFPFLRNYVSDFIAQTHQQYLGDINRRTIETYVIWLKSDLKLADIFKSSRNGLCEFLSDNEMLSSEITTYFKTKYRACTHIFVT